MQSLFITYDSTGNDLVVTGDIPDDLSRDAYCVLGMPIDVLDMSSALRDIETAAASKTRFLISTPNLHFLVKIQSDLDFRESLLLSDLCPADGMPVVRIARLLGIPIKDRVAGSDIFEALKAEHNSARPLRVFLFGGAEGVAAAASRALNARPSGLYCVGSFYPGYSSVEAMSHDDIIDEINSSDADLLIVSLGAKKGQSWLQRNHDRLLIPVRIYLGAVINFQAVWLDELLPFCENLVWNGCGASRRNPTFGDDIGMTVSCCCACCSHAFCRWPSGRRGCG